MNPSHPTVIDHVFKVLLLGDSSVGKSRYRMLINICMVSTVHVNILYSILVRFVDDYFSERLGTTVGVDFKAKLVKAKGEDGKMNTIKLTVWDTGITSVIYIGLYLSLTDNIQYCRTAGQERFRTMTTSYYRGAHAIILVYDVTSRTSFENLNMWLREIDQHSRSDDMIKLVVSNKIDQAQVVSKAEAMHWAATHRLTLVETSAKNKDGIDEIFDIITKMVII
jgi:Ras-related protein Rab-18